MVQLAYGVNAGHGRKIQEAVTQQIEELDYSPPSNSVIPNSLNSLIV